MDTVQVVSASAVRLFTWGTTADTQSTTAVSVDGNATTNPNAIYKESPYSTFQAILTGTGAVTATVVVQVSNDDTSATNVTSNWIALGTITLSGTTSTTDGFTSTASWRWVRSQVTAISGTSAAVKVLMGV
jgi:hypothetical protein